MTLCDMSHNYILQENCMVVKGDVGKIHFTK